MTVALGNIFSPALAGDKPTLNKQLFAKMVFMAHQQMEPRMWDVFPDAPESLDNGDSIFIPTKAALSGHGTTSAATDTPPFFGTTTDGNAEYEPTARYNATRWRYSTFAERQLNGEVWRWAEVLERNDKRLMNIDSIENVLIQDAKNSYARRKDQTIINALNATVLQWQKASAGMSSSTNQTGKSSSNKTLATDHVRNLGRPVNYVDLLDAVQLLEEAECPRPYICFLNSMQIRYLIASEEAKNSFIGPKALMGNPLDGFCGIERYIRTELLTLAGSVRQCWLVSPTALVKSSSALFPGYDQLPGNNYMNQLFLEQTLGAVRMYEDAVVQLNASEGTTP